MFDPTDLSHRRFNPLTRSWVLCSPHRAKRPWQGQREETSAETRPAYDPQCYLCPSNKRAPSADNPSAPPPQNPAYTSTFVFTNDFAAVKSKVDCNPEASHHHDDGTNNNNNNNNHGSDVDSGYEHSSGLLRAAPVTGTCRVICFSPRHDLTLAEMSVEEIVPVVEVWCAEYEQLAASGTVEHVQIFENKGAMMGCSNPHPHGQIWATSVVPEEPSKELASLLQYRNSKLALSSLSPSSSSASSAKVTSAAAESESAAAEAAETQSDDACLLCDYVRLETNSSSSSSSSNNNNNSTSAGDDRGERLGLSGSKLPRLVCENKNWIAVVPFWAVWPFEIMVLPRGHIRSLRDMSSATNPRHQQLRHDLADILRRVTCRYDNLFHASFPYSMGIHQAPTDGKAHDEAHLHVHFYPPLLRSSTVRKFLVGFEMLGEPQRDLTPEQAAAKLAACSEVHYKKSQQS